MSRSPSPPTPDPVRFTINRDAYLVAKAKAGLHFDQTVAAELGVHPVTWSRILSGKYPLVEAKARKLRELFPDDYPKIVTEVVPDAPTV